MHQPASQPEADAAVRTLTVYLNLPDGVVLNAAERDAVAMIAQDALCKAVLSIQHLRDLQLGLGPVTLKLPSGPDLEVLRQAGVISEELYRSLDGLNPLPVRFASAIGIDGGGEVDITHSYLDPVSGAAISDRGGLPPRNPFYPE